MRRSLFAVLGLAAMLAAALATCPAGAWAQSAPAFSLDKVDGGSVSLASLKGKVVVVNFFRTFCPYCIREVSELNDLHTRLGPKGVAVLGVGMDSQEKLARYAASHEVHYPVLVCTEQMRRAWGEIPGTGGLRAVPTTVVVNRSGEVSRVFLGAAAKGKIEHAVQALLPTD